MIATLGFHGVKAYSAPHRKLVAALLQHAAPLYHLARWQYSTGSDKRKGVITEDVTAVLRGQESAPYPTLHTLWKSKESGVVSSRLDITGHEHRLLRTDVRPYAMMARARGLSGWAQDCAALSGSCTG